MNSLDRETSILLLIDFQPKMFEKLNPQIVGGIKYAVTQVLIAARIMKVPVIFTQIDGKRNGNFLPEILNHYPSANVIERQIPGFDATLDPIVAQTITTSGRTQVVTCGLWTSMCFAFTALTLVSKNYQVYGLMDAAGDSTKTAHKYGIQRMIQSHVAPMTWMPVVSSWMRDWADSYAAQLTIEVFNRSP
jgi:nicotinamidase-related amidase